MPLKIIVEVVEYDALGMSGYIEEYSISSEESAMKIGPLFYDISGASSVYLLDTEDNRQVPIPRRMK